VQVSVSVHFLQFSLHLWQTFPSTNVPSGHESTQDPELQRVPTSHVVQVLPETHLMQDEEHALHFPFAE